MALSEKDPLPTTNKRLYELVSSAREPSQQVEAALDHLIKLSIHSQQHFPFLLHRVNWFERPLSNYRTAFFKITRLYRSKGKQSAKVIHNLVIQGFFSIKSRRESLECLVQMLSDGREQQEILGSLRENYPHKLCPLDIHTFYLGNLLQLCKKFPKYRADILEIIIENMVKFDTEVILGDEEVHNPFPNDCKLVEMRKNAANNELAIKLDQLMVILLEYLDELEEDPSILDQLLLVFQNKVLPIKTTKNIQLLMFAVAEKSKSRASAFISFLLANIFQHHQEHQNMYRVFAQSNFYLFSYLLRSRRVTTKTVTKTLLLMMERLRAILKDWQEITIKPQTQLKNTMQSVEIPLLTLQSIIMIKLSHHLNTPDTNRSFQDLLLQVRSKLQFQYFLNEQILNKIGVHCQRSSHLRLKFSNKFLPSTLPKTGPQTDSLMLQQQKSDLNQEGQIPRKITKGETPISYCSETVV